MHFLTFRMKYCIEYFLLVILLLLIQARGREQNFTDVFFNLTVSHDMSSNVKSSQSLEHIQRKTTDVMNTTAVVTKSSENNSTEVDINHQLYPSNSVRNHRTRLQQPQSLQIKSPFKEKSKWVSLAGCGFWRFQATDTPTKTEKTFRTYLQNNLLRAEDWFQCALRCSAEPDNSHFAFFKTVCMCTHNKHLVYDKDNESCFRMCDTIEQYCYSDVGLPVFVFKQSTKETKNPTKLMRYSHHCLYEENGEYKRKTKGFCIAKLSKEDCSNLNVIFSFGLPSSKLFVQWICENSTDAYTKYYRVIQKLTEYTSSTEQISMVASTGSVSESHTEEGTEQISMVASTGSVSESHTEQVVCQNSIFAITCPGNTTIHIQDAHYGRTDRMTCIRDFRFERFNCITNNTKGILLQHCENETSCSIPVNNDFFGINGLWRVTSRCFLIPKYLNITYFCQDENGAHTKTGSQWISCQDTDFSDLQDVNMFNIISFIIAPVTITVLVIIVAALCRMNCQLRKKLKCSLYANLSVDRVQYTHSTIPTGQHYMEVLPMSEYITPQHNTEEEGYITPIVGDELEAVGHYQSVV